MPYELSDAELQAIHEALPDLIPLQKRASHLTPELLSTAFAWDSRIPEAAVCLRDAVDVANEARFAAHEAAAHRLRYEKKGDSISAVFFGKFYLDDAALRLYAAGEHLANAIICMLELSKDDLREFQKDKVSRQATVGHFLRKTLPDTPMTIAVSSLGAAWFETVKYRNMWVHEQPPLVAGQGIQFRRGSRWQEQPDGSRVLALSGGDEAELQIDALSDTVVTALRQFSDVLHAVEVHYLELLRARMGDSLKIR